MRKGFTLVELIVVIAIIAILAAVIAPNAFKAIEKAKLAKTQRDLKSIKTAVSALYADTGKFPNGCPAFSSANPEVYFNQPQAGLVRRPTVGVVEAPSCEWRQSEVNAWDGPYLESTNVLDFWKTAYMFDPDYVPCGTTAGNCPATSSPYTECRAACGGAFNCYPPMLVSFGPDKLEYTCDDILVQLTLK
ncbi:MAG TPA: prepilin-type N-terminal cleavage/methylation domain-containing protein [Candidatus Omnitrophota bacterium]|nr:prepilin-type N-terminal cleavage/methylation domain-containing protein [Candidatus Omnitrophota bacterium]HRZ15773.1 prepilin-type N-terminal cleavage/methylation domain-containing protein [Candidatus Omnitrophota bacterium]